MESLVEVNRRKNFEIFESALACVIFILLNLVFSFFIYLIPQSTIDIPIVYYLLSFLVEFLFAIAAWIVAKSRKIEIVPAIGINKKINGKIVGLGFLITLVCLIFFASLSNTFSDFLTILGYSSEISEGVAERITTNFWTYLASIIVTCIAPALFEEILFRGVILSGFKSYGKKIAVILSALIFMLMHGNADQTVHQFIIGLVVGYIFIETGNLWLGVVIHFFNNFVAITELYIFSLILKNSNLSQLEAASESVTEEVAVNPWVALLVEAIVSFILAYIGFKLIKKLISKICSESQKVNQSDVKISEENEIVVDGEAIQTEGTIEGDAEINSQAKVDGTEKTNEKQHLSAGTIVMFVIAGAYLIYDWVLSLVTGFLK